MMIDDRLEKFITDVGQSVALGLVPFLGQAIDVYDTLHAAYDLYQSKDMDQAQKDEGYFDMAMALVGWIPGPGDGIKKTLKVVNKNPKEYAPLLLDAVRYGLYEAGYKVDPYAFLMESISEGKIRSLLNACKDKLSDSSIYKKSPQWMQEGMMLGIELAGQSIPLLVGVVERKVKTWLHHAPKSSASQISGTQVTEKHVKHEPAQQPNAKDEVSKQGRPNAHQAINGTITAIEIGAANINQLQESVGEHVADYYCNDTLGLGVKHRAHAQHDAGDKGAKLTDWGHLKQLKSNIVKIRGVGIDAVWRGEVKPYAVMDYKAREIGLSELAMKRLLVAESAQDVDSKGAHRQNQAAWRKRRKEAVKQGQTFNEPKPNLDKNVPKMSHKWIQQRLGTVMGLSDGQKQVLENPNGYTRHVIQVVTSKGDGEIHRKELEMARSQNREVIAAKHPAHAAGINNYMNVFTEAPEKENVNSTTQTRTEKRRGQR